MNAQVEICLDDLVAIQHELKAPKDKTNTFGKYKYRSCESILEAVKPLLHKYGCKLTLSDDSKEMCGIPVVIAIATFTDSKGNQTVVKAEAGVDINKKGMDVAQTFGASSSYARKYALNGLFLSECYPTENYNMLLVGIHDKELKKEFIFITEGRNHKLDYGDILVVIGKSAEIERFKMDFSL